MDCSRDSESTSIAIRGCDELVDRSGCCGASAAAGRTWNKNRDKANSPKAFFMGLNIGVKEFSIA